MCTRENTIHGRVPSHHPYQARDKHSHNFGSHPPELFLDDGFARLKALQYVANASRRLEATVGAHDKQQCGLLHESVSASSREERQVEVELVHQPLGVTWEKRQLVVELFHRALGVPGHLDVGTTVLA